MGLTVNWQLAQEIVVNWHLVHKIAVLRKIVRGLHYLSEQSNVLEYLISFVSQWLSNTILNRLRILLYIASYWNVSLFSIAGKF